MKKKKGSSGATHLLNRADISGLERWETCTIEIARIVESLEENIEAKTIDDLINHIMKTGVRFNVTLQQKSRNCFNINIFEEINLLNISNHLYFMTKKQESN